MSRAQYIDLTLEALMRLAIGRLASQLPKVTDTGGALVIAFAHKGKQFHAVGPTFKDLFIDLLCELDKKDDASKDLTVAQGVES